MAKSSTNSELTKNDLALCELETGLCPSIPRINVPNSGSSSESTSDADVLRELAGLSPVPSYELPKHRSPRARESPDGSLSGLRAVDPPPVHPSAVELVVASSLPVEIDTRVTRPRRKSHTHCLAKPGSGLKVHASPSVRTCVFVKPGMSVATVIEEGTTTRGLLMDVSRSLLYDLPPKLWAKKMWLSPESLASHLELQLIEYPKGEVVKETTMPSSHALFPGIARSLTTIPANSLNPCTEEEVYLRIRMSLHAPSKFSKFYAKKIRSGKYTKKKKGKGKN